MTITRNNYEEFFLLYVDNELSTSGKKAVEAFVRENSDLEKELTRLMQSTFKPETDIIFDDKRSLMKHAEPASFINANNAEEYFLLYLDDELDKHTRTAVELFAGQHPEQQQAFDLLMQTKLDPDLTVTFAGKHDLFRNEETEKKILFPWFRVAAAAAILLIIAAVFVFTNKTHIKAPETFAKVKDSSNKQAKNIAATNGTEIKKELPAVTSVSRDPLDNKDKSTAKMTLKENKTGKKTEPTSKVTDVQDLLVADINNRVLPAKTDLVKAEIAGLGVERTNSDPGTILIAATDPLDRTIRTSDIASTREQANYGRIALEENNQANTNEELYLGNTTPNKNKLPGIFRKVSRVFDKNANADDDSKRGVLIGGFQIALK